MPNNDDFTSKHHDITIKTIGYEEPNNGRVLRIINLVINGNDVTAKFFGAWNRIIDTVDRYVMDSPDGKFVYVPAESNFLIDCRTYEKISLPGNPLSAATFIGNSFSDNKLLVVHCDKIIVVDTESSSETIIPFSDHMIEWAQFDTNNDLIIKRRDRKLGLLETSRFDFKQHKITNRTIESGTTINQTQISI